MIAASEKPKLFICADRDNYTSMATYHERIKALSGKINDMAVIEGKDHYEIESPEYDDRVASWICAFIQNKVTSEG
jgi:hypothetical protein